MCRGKSFNIKGSVLDLASHLSSARAVISAVSSHLGQAKYLGLWSREITSIASSLLDEAVSWITIRVTISIASSHLDKAKCHGSQVGLHYLQQVLFWMKQNAFGLWAMEMTSSPSSSWTMSLENNFCSKCSSGSSKAT